MGVICPSHTLLTVIHVVVNAHHSLTKCPTNVKLSLGRTYALEEDQDGPFREGWWSLGL